MKFKFVSNEALFNQQKHPWISYAAACWALMFGIFHILWAAGWYIGLDPEQSRTAFANPWFLAYDIAVAVMCIIAVPIALALGMTWGQMVPRRILITLASIGTSLLVMRAAASLIQASYLVLMGQFAWSQLGVWEPWFYAGAVIFSLNLWQYWQRSRAMPPPNRPLK